MAVRFLSVLIAIFLLSCNGTPPKEPVVTQNSTEFTMAQYDSIGKAYSPEIGTYGGKITLAIGADPDGFCPALSMSGYSFQVMAYIYEGLITADPVTLEKEPYIAKSWEKSEDGKTWTFHLRDDIYFSDSVKLSAHDVAFTFNDVIFNDPLNSPRNITYRIAGEKFTVEAVDSFTVKFHLPKPFAPFLDIAGASIMPKHAYEKAAADTTLKSYLSKGAPVTNVIGTGPFILESVEQGQKITLKRNPNYWQKDAKGNALPYLDNIVLKVINQPDIQMTKFQKGELDQLAVLGENYSILKEKEQNSSYKIIRVGPRWYNRFVKFNQNNQKDSTGAFFVPEKKQKLFRNKVFRQAIAHSIDYDQIINIVYYGLATKTTGLIGKHHGKFHNPNAPLYDYNPEKADSMFKSIGLIDRDGDGFIEDATGEKVSFSFAATADVKLIKDIAGIIKKDLSERGITMHLNLVEFNTLMAKTNETYDWDAVCFSLGVPEEPHFGKSSYLASSPRYIVNPQRKDHEGNLIPKTILPWEQEIIDIFEAGAVELNEEKRIAIYQKWLQIEQEQCSMILLPVREVILGYQERFGNIHLTPKLNQMETVFHNIEEIYIK